MIRITPIRRALVPVDSDAAHAVADRNYDEFQGDHEIWKRLKDYPNSILRVTMSHCEADSITASSGTALRLRWDVRRTT